MWPALISDRTWEGGSPNSRLRSFESNSCISTHASLAACGFACSSRRDRALRRLALLQGGGALGAARIDARPQRFHQIDDVAAGRCSGRLGQRDLLALDFLLDRRLDAPLELVLILVR